MKEPKQVILLFLLIAVVGFLTLLFKKDYSAESNLQSNLNWYSLYNSKAAKP